RPRRRQRLRALDLRALELAPQVRLERADLVAREIHAKSALALHQPARLAAQAERAADPLDVDAEHAAALAAAPEPRDPPPREVAARPAPAPAARPDPGDRQPRGVARRRLVAVADRLQDLLAQRVVVDPIAARDPVRILAGGAVLAHAVLERRALGGAEEVA